MVTNQTTQAQYAKILRLGLADCFDVIVTSEDAGAEKPDPRIFRMVLLQLGLRPEQVLAEGDGRRVGLVPEPLVAGEFIDQLDDAVHIGGCSRSDHGT